MTRLVALPTLVFGALPVTLAGQIAQAGPGASPSFAGWNIEYTLPSGWQVGQVLGRVQMLASMSDAGAIFVAPGLYGNFQEIVADLSTFYQSLGLVAYPVEQPAEGTVAGLRAMTATYASQDQMGQMVHGRVVAVLTPHGTGFVVLGMTTPQQMQGLRATVDRVVESVKARPPEVNQQAMAALAGRWMYYAGKADGVTSVTGGSSRSHEEFVTFDGQGRWEWQSSSSVSVTVPGGAGAGGAQSNADQGSYTVIGTTLVLKGTQGQQTFEIQILPDRLIADGRVYLKQ